MTVPWLGKLEGAARDVDPGFLQEGPSLEGKLGTTGRFGTGPEDAAAPGKAATPGISFNFGAQREKLTRQRCHRGGDGVDEAPGCPSCLLSSEVGHNFPAKSFSRQAQAVPAAASLTAVPGPGNCKPQNRHAAPNLRPSRARSGRDEGEGLS